MTAVDRVHQPITAGALLRHSLATARNGGVAVLTLAFAANILLILAGRPLIGFLFHQALLLNGQNGVDLANLSLSAKSALSLVLVLVLGLVAFALVVLQLAVIIVALRQIASAGRLDARELLSALRSVAGRLFRRTSIPVFLYLFVLLPVSGLGFFSTLTQVIAVPNFVSGELLKNPVTAVLWHLLMLVILWVNIRFALAMPIFFAAAATGGHAMRLSWRAMRVREIWALVVATLAVLIPATLLAVVIALASVIPTVITDRTAPALSAVTSASSMAIGTIALLLILSAASVFVLSIVSTLADQVGVTTSGGDEPARSYSGTPWLSGLVIVATALVIPLQLTLTAPIRALDAPPDTAVLAHRGYIAGGVENTIPALEAAALIGADRVEMDVMQTGDGEFVVIHDFNLDRLAGQNVDVKDLTLEELTAVTVYDTAGHTATIPSLEEYVTRARELEIPLLIEVKLGGLDSPDHVDLLVQQLDELDALEGNHFHSLDPASVERLKELVPNIEVGYILSFSGFGVPDTSADFLVIEEYTASDNMQQWADDAGLGFYVWTADDELAQRLRFRQDADAIITDRPDTALGAREEIRTETGLAPALLDLMMGFVLL